VDGQHPKKASDTGNISHLDVATGHALARKDRRIGKGRNDADEESAWAKELR